VDFRLIIAAAILFIVTSVPAISQNGLGWERTAAQTDYLFLCSGCHGRTGIGDGIVSQKLKVPPADLTRLAANNDGIFPYREVIEIIDGRQMIESHSVREMPIWGWHFWAEARDSNTLLPIEPQVKNRVSNLANYIATLQSK